VDPYLLHPLREKELMPVTRRDPPSGAAEAVRAALQHFAGVPESQLHALRGTKPAELALTVPHPVFNLGLSDLVSTAALGSARLTGWRYLLRQSGQIVASAETVTGEEGREKFSHFNRGPFVASTAAALATAEGLVETKDRAYELRLLHVPALYTMALWLYGGGSNDLLIPLVPSPDGIEANRAYPADELLSVLADKANQIPHMESDDTRGG
jgi:hypothetical protein